MFILMHCQNCWTGKKKLSVLKFVCSYNIFRIILLAKDENCWTCVKLKKSNCRNCKLVFKWLLKLLNVKSVVSWCLNKLFFCYFNLICDESDLLFWRKLLFRSQTEKCVCFWSLSNTFSWTRNEQKYLLRFKL
jgi:hypothetical protein